MRSLSRPRTRRIARQFVQEIPSWHSISVSWHSISGCETSRRFKELKKGAKGVVDGGGTPKDLDDVRIEDRDVGSFRDDAAAVFVSTCLRMVELVFASHFGVGRRSTFGSLDGSFHAPSTYWDDEPRARRRTEHVHHASGKPTARATPAHESVEKPEIADLSQNPIRSLARAAIPGAQRRVRSYWVRRLSGVRAKPARRWHQLQRRRVAPPERQIPHSAGIIARYPRSSAAAPSPESASLRFCHRRLFRQPHTSAVHMKRASTASRRMGRTRPPLRRTRFNPPENSARVHLCLMWRRNAATPTRPR